MDIIHDIALRLSMEQERNAPPIRPMWVGRRRNRQPCNCNIISKKLSQIGHTNSATAAVLVEVLNDFVPDCYNRKATINKPVSPYV